MTRAPRLLLDTHVWYWYAAGSRDLHESLREALDESLGACWLSPISIWEVGVLVDKGRIRLKNDFRDWVDEALTAFPIQEAGVNFEVARRVGEVRLDHGDPADRFLAATALVYDLTLVTIDRRLTEADWLPTLTA